ncbi:MAG: hypothetical protein ACLFNZ_08145 [Spirochaetaceae bacterium]
METANFPSGRKVFYFFPAGPYHKTIVKNIIKKEIEIYTLSDIKRGLPLIFQYNGAVILFHIDEFKDFEHIKTIIRDFSRQTSHRSIEIFLLTRAQEKYEDIEEYMKEIGNCSPHLLDSSPERASEELIDLLLNLNVRGQRNYVRFGTNNNSVASIEIMRKNRKIIGTVHDISTAGVSFSLPEGPAFSIRTKLRDFAVDIDGRIEGLAGTVTIKRKLPNGSLLYVLMFDKEVSQEISEQLHAVIHGSLQRQFTERLNLVAVP